MDRVQKNAAKRFGAVLGLDGNGSAVLGLLVPGDLRNAMQGTVKKE
jgi:hypothetical protein